MPVYLFACILLGALIILGGVTEGILLLLLISVYPVAWYWVHKQYYRAFVLPLISWLLAGFIAGDLLLALVLIFSLFPGVLVGMLIDRGQSLGKSLCAVTAVIFLFSGGSSALMWPVIRENWHLYFQSYQEQLTQNTAGAGNEHALALVAWFDLNWAYVSFGMLFGMILLSQLLLVALLFARLRKETSSIVHRYEFGRLRPPEPLVWVVIVASLGWFWDDYYPNDALRLLVWNGAIMLAFVYLVNGISIVAFAATLFQMRRMTLVFIVFTLIVFNLYQILPVVGLFDTWIDFRSWFGQIRHKQLKEKEPDL
ncbi:MAG: DUF2232 domain-containing protein [Candidatus Hydrogenedens sp.]|jgi:hypothetical protein|nr:DUF2232 domain-containing protein [Candidatus Hydrogenedens sp.]